MEEADAKYEAVIGLEIHVQLRTVSKMFCRCDNDSDKARPNTNVCPVCMGYPGTLPVTNEQAIDWGIKTALALGCAVNPLQRFDRKNYFYPDLPKGYQISQFFYPVGEKGNVDVDYLASDRKTRKEFSVGITRLHLEEDAGKLIHTQDGTLVDLNRCGTPLIEIVTEPDIKSPEEAKAFMQELQRMVRSLGVSMADMEKGHLRVDANVSVRPIGQDVLGAKVEVKNMNSFKFMEMALKFEVERQTAMLEKGEVIEQETRGWDEKTNSTVSQRTKEGSVDYRYFPEPDLPPIYIDQDKIDGTKNQLAALPAELRSRGEASGLPYARVVELQDLGKMSEFVQLTTDYNDIDPVLLANWITKDFASTKDLREFVIIVKLEGLSNAAAQKLYALMQTKKLPPQDLVGQIQMADKDELTGLVKQVLAENADAVAKFKAGNTQVLAYLTGQVMKKSGGRAEPALAQQILQSLLTD
ncbi:MAG: aspartyl/glutamyl-tRNA amidotransferase subunit B, aspartyl-tRNA(Asn)/glutamyl-tRNA (Gln) amidotransferase subunit B [candidate division Kazan bacterium GW2011_GWA1_50_15]|nr:MAG: aspartyl/glutamyl-tRNA amidotransferase subunit B, aspartyl-tRNA(Asn)/glutamyl-tRNA (Gln) amidotransferase subunit B [candidate division Kazan bacterium GW2011_GWA1_50_15]